jgi:hypothetical protein
VGALALDFKASDSPNSYLVSAYNVGGGGGEAGLDRAKVSDGSVTASVFGGGGGNGDYQAAGSMPVVVAAGDYLIGMLDNSSNYTLEHRGPCVSSGCSSWGTTTPTIDGFPTGPLVLSRTVNGSTSASYVVPTSKGTVYEIAQDGTVLWKQPLTSGNVALHEGNINNGDGNNMATAYFGGADGVVYAVIVDGVLSTSAPWPKVRYDQHNSGHIGYH